jgi:AcrR family transcriptional regulator
MLRDEILHAAGALLNERGYAAMSMDDLANRVGISKPTLYSHFTTKEDLIVAAVLRAHDRIAESLQADPSPRTPLQQLSFILRTVVLIQIEEGGTAPRPWAPEVFRLLCTRDEIVERLKLNDQAIAELVRAGIEAGEIDPRLDAATIVRAFFSIVNTLNTPFMFGSRIAEPAAIARTLAAIFERGVRSSDGL